MSLISQMIKFGMVGGLGTLTNLFVFFLISDVGNLHPTLASIAAFAFAVTQNYFLNQIWTFRYGHNNEHLSFVRYGKFVAVSLFGLAINLIVLSLVIRFWKNIPYNTIAQAMGIAFGMVLNFIGAKVFVFRRKEGK